MYQNISAMPGNIDRQRRTNRQVGIKVAISVGGHAQLVITHADLYFGTGQPTTENTPGHIGRITQHAPPRNGTAECRLAEHPAHHKDFPLGTVTAVGVHHHPAAATVPLHRFCNNVGKPFGKACPLVVPRH